MLTEKERDPFSTAWMISTDAASGITTGISAYDRGAHDRGAYRSKE